jgi:hypothetical protein
MSERPATGALLHKREGMETLSLDLPTKHENRSARNSSGLSSIFIKESKCYGSVTGVRRYVGLKPPGIREKGEATARDIVAQSLPEIIRGG